MVPGAATADVDLFDVSVSWTLAHSCRVNILARF